MMDNKENKMKNQYIKLDENNNIIDLFWEHQKNKFDGSEIFFEEVDDNEKLKINGKSISNEYGAPIFQYDDGCVYERTQSEIDNDYKTLDALVLKAEKELGETDAYMPRIMNDYMDLMEAGVELKEENLPPAAQDKLIIRREKREAYKNLIGE